MPAAGRDVHDRCEHQPAIVGLNRPQPDLYRNLGSVLPPPEELPSAAHRPGRRRSPESAPVGVVGHALGFGQEQVDRLPDKLFSRVPKLTLELTIHQYDRSLSFRDKYAGWRCLDCEAERFAPVGGALKSGLYLISPACPHNPSGKGQPPYQRTLVVESRRNPRRDMRFL